MVPSQGKTVHSEGGYRVIEAVVKPQAEAAVVVGYYVFGPKATTGRIVDKSLPEVIAVVRELIEEG